MMKLDDVKKLHQKKYRNQFGYYLVEGEHLILELLKATEQSSIIDLVVIYVTEEKEPWAAKLVTRAKIVPVSSKQMAQLSDTKSPQGIIARVPMPEATDTQQQVSPKERCIYLHEVQDPGNLGTILRTMAWFGNFRLLLSPNSVDPYNSKVVRASMGAIFHVPIEQDISFSDILTRFDRLAYLDMQGEPIQSDLFTEYPCYLFGNEARGIPEAVLTHNHASPFTIAGSGNIDSLNLATAVAICAYEIAQSPANLKH